MTQTAYAAKDLLDVVRHQRIAAAALDKLGALGVKSANKPWNLDKKQRAENLSLFRSTLNDAGYWADFRKYTQWVEMYRIGNCWERGTVFAYYASQDPAIEGSHLYRVQAVGWDHVWSVLTTRQLGINQTYGLEALGASGVVLDGWSEDWWFPNIDNVAAMKIGCWRAGNPFALSLRVRIQTLNRRFQVQARCGGQGT